MTHLQIENKLAKSYLTLIEKLSPEVKLDMVSKISLSLKKKKKNQRSLQKNILLEFGIPKKPLKSLPKV